MVHASLVTFPLGFKQTAAGGASWDRVLGSDLCFPGCLSLTGPGSVAGTTGSSLRVRCQYEKAYKGHNKYWCRGKYGRVCRKIVETKGEEKEKRNGRVSIRDHTDNLTFTVTMENLNMNDAGSYWCRIQTIWILDVLSWDPSVQVEVSVFPGSSAVSGPRAVRGVEQGSLTVQCRYDPGWEPHVKWWCRGADWSSCRFVVKTNNGSEKEVKQGRVSIKDNWKDRSFTMTMQKLRLDDSDTYWCGIERVGVDLGDDVDVTIDPAVSISTRATSNANMFTAPLVPEGHLPLLGSVHFLVLVFLKVPLFLGMLGAVLWVNRPLRSSGGKPQENQQPPCSSTFQEQKTLKQKEKAFFSGIDSRQWRLWFLRHRGSPLQELVP
ncbi:hypothetical protein CapIbe_017412 [Capra ibex]